jgi:hypothetical protein
MKRTNVAGSKSTLLTLLASAVLCAAASTNTARAANGTWSTLGNMNVTWPAALLPG